MNPETVDVVMGVIERIADMLEPSAQAVWAIAMRQVMVQAIHDAILVLLGILVGTVMFRIAVLSYQRGDLEHDTDKGIDLTSNEMRDCDAYWTVAFITGAAGLLAILLTISLLGGLIGRLVNPAYYAIDLLLKIAGAN